MDHVAVAIVSSIAGTLILVAGSVVAWSIRRLVGTLDKVNESVQGLQGVINTMEWRVRALETLHTSAHEHTDRRASK